MYDHIIAVVKLLPLNCKPHTSDFCNKYLLSSEGITFIKTGKQLSESFTSQTSDSLRSDLFNRTPLTVVKIPIMHHTTSAPAAAAISEKS